MNNKKGFIKRIIAWFNEDIECLRPIVNWLNEDVKCFNPIINNSASSLPKNADSASHCNSSVNEATTEIGLILYEGTETQFNNVSLDSSSDINPATGFPMCGGVDIAGNLYGIDMHTTGFDTNPATGLPYGVDSCTTNFNNDSSISSYDTHNDY